MAAIHLEPRRIRAFCPTSGVTPWSCASTSDLATDEARAAAYGLELTTERGGALAHACTVTGASRLHAATGSGVLVGDAGAERRGMDKRQRQLRSDPRLESGRAAWVGDGHIRTTQEPCMSTRTGALAGRIGSVASGAVPTGVLNRDLTCRVESVPSPRPGDGDLGHAEDAPLARERWSIVLAAGSGRRLAGVTGGVPKQFWSADGSRTLLDETLDRVARVVPASRTVIVVDRTHAPFVRALADGGAHRLVYQPRDRGTAAGVLLGLTEVTAVEPDAVVLVTPSDHGIAKVGYFVSGIRQVAAHVEAGVCEVVLFGVAPSAPEGDYGWITPADPRGGVAQGMGQVASFVEKPPAHVAGRLWAGGAVWNTMVLVARASALLALYRRHLPPLADVFCRARDLSASDRLAYLSARYDDLTAADFSRDLLGRATGLSVHTWPASMGWSDLGTPERLARWRDGGLLLASRAEANAS